MYHECIIKLQARAVDRWISGGAPRNKLILGLTGTATSFTLANRTATDVGSPVKGTGKAGPYLGREGHVCEMIRNGAIQCWDDEQKMAYAYMGDQWVGYGNQKSMKEKVKFAYSRNIAGVMFWSMDQDDFMGHYCNAGEFPLLTAIYNAIKELTPKDKHVVGDVITSATHATTPNDSLFQHQTNKNRIVSNSASELKKFCYFTNWSKKLASFDARFEIRDINVTLCTHLIYAFANIDGTNMKLMPSENDDDNGQLVNKKGRYFDFNKLKIEHRNLETLLSIGGAWARNDGFIQVHSPQTMKLFSKNVAIYLRDRDFDGIDVGWEWPGDIYRNKHSTLLKIMRDESDKESVRTNKPRLLISIAVAVEEQTITDSYNISEISRYQRIKITNSFGIILSAWAVDRWISGGAPRIKLILGLTGAATSFTLANRTATDVGSPVKGAGKAGPFMGREGRVTYYRVCEMIRNGAIQRWDDEQKMAYAYMEDQWVGYGNPKSMKEKVFRQHFT
ncbi:acidic mammalian chitinase-like [Mercenaria mercenaria]|uniref:acidic mammalian chitinase-like n=1 Tax=Mercenaria mercenaria TaxID=6596 RepID=UPI00234ECCCF|nr:acidic mammalian chitinase-like [Mercenaria mercenaria]